jgi:hypothetical protein
VKKSACNEGVMARIRINTEDLKNKAKDFESAAEAFIRAGDEILAAATSLPSYDGQLSGPARKAGCEIQTQMRDLRTCLAGDAESLMRAKQAFEDLDKQVINSPTENQEALSMSSLPPIREGGNSDYLAYKDFGDYVIFWKTGEPITIYKTDENISMVLQFEKDVDDAAKYLTKVLEIADVLTQGLLGDIKILCVLVIVACLAYLAGELIAAVAAELGATTGQIEDAKKIAEAFKTVVDIASGAGGYDIPGILKHFGVQTVDPWEAQQDIKDIQQYWDLYQRSYSDAVNEWDALAPKTPSTPATTGPTPVPAPTPPAPTPTPTPPSP